MINKIRFFIVVMYSKIMVHRQDKDSLQSANEHLWED